MTTFDIRIGRLVLRGVSPLEAEAVVEGLRAGLERTFAKQDGRRDRMRSANRAQVRQAIPYTAEAGTLGDRAAHGLFERIMA